MPLAGQEVADLPRPSNPHLRACGREEPPTIGDGANEVDNDSIGVNQRKNLLERLVRIVDKDNEKFVLKLMDRIDTVGVEMPTIEVRFENLNVEAEAFSGSRALAFFINFNRSLVEDDTAFRSSQFREDHTDACFGWKARSDP
ncbi:hypothetical protein AgCh_014243 [Apium graveolens]